MDILDTINNIIESNLFSANLKYCLVDSKKHPFKSNGEPVRPNVCEDFVELENLLQSTDICSYSGIGISIQASDVCAIDVDHCFATPFDVSTADSRAKDVINRFKDVAYIEFSFSGQGLRVIFKTDLVENYSAKYYIKNASNSVEYYQPSKSYRYVTVTGKTIENNRIEYNKNILPILQSFLDDYMIKPVKPIYQVKTNAIETRTYEDLMNIVKMHYFKNYTFQNLWFDPAPGSGSNESERDYQLVAYLYENVTRDKSLLKQIFETSPFFKSKDTKHINKWRGQEGRYFNYLYDVMQKRH